MIIDKKDPYLRGLGFAVVGFAVFAVHDVIIKFLGTTYSVFQIIFFTMLFAFLPTTIIMLADKAIDNFRPHHPWLVLLRSTLLIISMSGAFYAFVSLPLTEAYALLFATPLLITIFSVLLLGEVVRFQRWAAVVIGLFGVFIVLKPGLSILSLGHVAAIMAACTSALASIVVRKIGSEERSAVLIVYPMLFSMLVVGAIMPIVYIPIELLHLALMVALGLLSVFAQLCIIFAYRKTQAAVVAPTQYSQIIWATAFGAIFFSEWPGIHVAIGSTIIIASGMFVVWRESRENVSARNPVLKNPNLRFDATPPSRWSSFFNRSGVRKS